MSVAILRTTVGLSFSCENLPSKDLLSASDPLVLLSKWDGTRWTKYGRTEFIKNTSNPHFSQILNTDYYFETEQRFRCDVYDADSANIENFAAHDHIGYAEFSLARLMSSPASTMKILLIKASGETRSKATITIRGDELKDNNDFAWVDIQAINLKKKSLLFGKDDTFLTVFRAREDGQGEVVIHRTEIIMDSQSPHWKPFKISMGALTNCEPNATFGIRVTHQREGLAASPLQVIGEIKVCVNDVLYPDGSTSPNPTLHLLSREHSGSVGQLKINRFHVFREHSFLEFLAGGLDLRLVVAVDFTASNGHPMNPKSLHHISHDGRLNEYQQAIQSVGHILCDYTKKTTFPSFGFGAQINGQNTVSHCFPLDFGVPMASQPGVEGILSRYRFALDRVQLAGPTNFSQILGTVENMATEPFQANYQHYTILLILTDGVIDDFAQTVDRIIGCSEKPLSIVIVGVGAADYSKMQTLDADTQPLRSGNRVSKRDCVQFVPYRQTLAQGPHVFSSAVLGEIPKQVKSFMELHKIHPLAPRAADPNAIDLASEIPPVNPAPAYDNSSSPQPQPAYPSQQPNYSIPPQASYPSQQPNYPYAPQATYNNQPNYAPIPSQSGYPGQQSNYAPQPSYPGQQSNYAPPSGYPGQQPNYAQANPTPVNQTAQTQSNANNSGYPGSRPNYGSR